MTAPPRRRIVVLASGGGSNLAAILAYLESLGDARCADVVAVASDRAAAGALERARARGVEAVQLHTARTPAGEPAEAMLERLRPDVIALAGYLRLVPEHVVRQYHGRIVNVHPALLPGFGGPGMYGARVHEAVLRAGTHVSGPTVHFVDEEFDRGAIIAQWPVPVLPTDDPATLAARVLRAEHALYPRVVHALAAGTVRLGADGRTAWTAPLTMDDPQFALLDAAAGAPSPDQFRIDARYPGAVPSLS